MKKKHEKVCLNLWPVPENEVENKFATASSLAARFTLASSAVGLGRIRKSLINSPEMTILLFLTSFFLFKDGKCVETNFLTSPFVMSCREPISQR